MKLVFKLKKGRKKESGHTYGAKRRRAFLVRRSLCWSDFLAGGNDLGHTEVTLKVHSAGTEGGGVAPRCASVLLIPTEGMISFFFFLCTQSYTGKGS